MKSAPATKATASTPAIALPAPVKDSIAGAVRAGDYPSVEHIIAEALLFWHFKRKHELEAMVQLHAEIGRLLAEKKPDAFRIRALSKRGRQFLALQQGQPHGSRA